MIADIQERIYDFVDTYAPATDAGRRGFVTRLRAIMNDYARNAIEHGDIPETGVPHKEKPAPQKAQKDERR